MMLTLFCSLQQRDKRGKRILLPMSLFKSEEIKARPRMLCFPTVEESICVCVCARGKEEYSYILVFMAYLSGKATT